MSDKDTYKNKVLKDYEELELELMVLLILQCQELNGIELLSRKEFYTLQSEYGRKIYKKTLKEFNKGNTERKKEIKILFKTQTEEIKKEYPEYNISTEQRKIINKNIKLTNHDLDKLAKDIAKGTKRTIKKMMGDLYKKVVRGNETFDNGFKSVTRDFYNKGITFKDSAGRNRSIEATVRQNLLYRINETNRKIYENVGKKLDTTGVQINISPNCRDKHQDINGQTFTNEEWKQYEYLTEEYNCQHVAKPIFIEIEKNIYSQKEIYEANNKMVNYKGDQMSYYEATQKQRALERAIRNAKKNVTVAKRTGIDISKAQSNLSNAQSRMREYIKETGLTRDYDREYFAGYN